MYSSFARLGSSSRIAAVALNPQPLPPRWGSGALATHGIIIVSG